jgi:hypothetical protein
MQPCHYLHFIERIALLSDALPYRPYITCEYFRRSLTLIFRPLFMQQG